MSHSTTKVFFDFDGTITTKDSLLPFIIFVVGWPKFLYKSISFIPQLLKFMVNRQQRSVTKNKALLVYLSSYSTEELTERAEQFVATVVPNMMRKEGVDAYQAHMKAGHDCILVSASVNLYLDIWARKHGFVKVISTPFLGTPPNMMGENCYGEEKVVRIKAVLPDLDQYTTIAYGDTVGDIPMLTTMNQGFMWSKAAQKFQKIESMEK